MYEGKAIDTLIPILPLLSLKGEPYTLDHHAPFEPLFKLSIPRRSYWKTGRQVSKTTGLSAQSVMQTATQSHFATLFVAPRFEQIRRVSANYIRPFIETSLMEGLLTNKYVENSVLQKSFLNESKMFLLVRIPRCRTYSRNFSRLRKVRRDSRHRQHLYPRYPRMYVSIKIRY